MEFYDLEFIFLPVIEKFQKLKDKNIQETRRVQIEIKVLGFRSFFKYYPYLKISLFKSNTTDEAGKERLPRGYFVKIQNNA